LTSLAPGRTIPHWEYPRREFISKTLGRSRVGLELLRQGIEHRGAAYFTKERVRWALRRIQ
jgi:hypothetical protein